MDTEDIMSPVQKWYVDEMNHLGEYTRAARYRVDIVSLAAAKKAILEVRLGGNIGNIYKPETPQSVKDEWNEASSKQIKLLMEAERVHKEMGAPRLKEELPKFLRDDIGRWVEEEVSAGWYQNSVGVLYHYDGVVWDDVPKENIKDLEFLGD